MIIATKYKNLDVTAQYSFRPALNTPCSEPKALLFSAFLFLVIIPKYLWSPLCSKNNEKQVWAMLHVYYLNSGLVTGRHGGTQVPNQSRVAGRQWQDLISIIHHVFS